MSPILALAEVVSTLQVVRGTRSQRVETIAVCRLVRKPAEVYGNRVPSRTRNTKISIDSQLCSPNVSHETKCPSAVFSRAIKFICINKINKIIQKNVVTLYGSCAEYLSVPQKGETKKGRTLVKRSPVLWNTRWETLVFNSPHVDCADTPWCTRRMYFSETRCT